METLNASCVFKSVLTHRLTGGVISCILATAIVLIDAAGRCSAHLIRIGAGHVVSAQCGIIIILVIIVLVYRLLLGLYLLGLCIL